MSAMFWGCFLKRRYDWHTHNIEDPGKTGYIVHHMLTVSQQSPKGYLISTTWGPRQIVRHAVCWHPVPVCIASLLLAAALSIPHEHNPVHVERGHSAVTRNARHATYSIWANTQAHLSSPLYLLRRIHFITKVFFHFQDFLGRKGTCFRYKLKQTQGLQDYLSFAKKPLPTILTSLWHSDVTKAKLIKTCTKTWTSTATTTVTTTVLLQWFHCIFLL